MPQGEGWISFSFLLLFHLLFIFCPDANILTDLIHWLKQVREEREERVRKKMVVYEEQGNF